MGSARKWFKSISNKKKVEDVSASEKPNKWKLWKSFKLIGRKFNHAEREASKRNRLCGVGKNAMPQEERAAICIQTAFRVFLARRALRALKGLVRLQAAISGHDTPKQNSVSLHCIYAFVRVQARIHRQRAGKSGDALGLPRQEAPGLVQEKCRADPEMEWCNALGTVEEIQAKEQQRQMAAIKRERAIAYAFCNKWKSNTKINPGSLFDYELDNSTWVWIWLDEWLNGQTKKRSIARGNNKQKNDCARNKMMLKDTTAAVGIQKAKSFQVSADKTNARKVARTRIGSPSRFRLARSLSGGKGRKVNKASSAKLNPALQPKKSADKLKQQPSKDLKPKTSLKNAQT